MKHRITVLVKLIGIVVLGLIMVITVGYAGWMGLQKIDRAQAQILEAAKADGHAKMIDMYHEGLRSDVLAILTATLVADTQSLVNLRDEVPLHLKAMRSEVAALEERAQSPAMRKAVTEAKPHIDAYIALCESLIELTFRDDNEAIQRLPELNKAFDELAVELVSLSSAIQKEAQEASTGGTLAMTSARRTIVLVGLVGILLLMAGSFVIARIISTGLTVAVAAAEKMTAGDITVQVEVTSHDEIGMLQQAMRKMIERLSQIIAEVRSGAAALSSASSQISASAQALAQGTSEQAASVEETTSSLQQMSASIEQNADNTRAMEQMAVKGARDAEDSGRAVTDTVEAMNSIAQKISIIEEIAYQTNLLALNAAIEAARAGEHGRGFAVVATEVRKLAERSQAAAKEIGSMAKSSVKVAERSGQLLTELVPSIRKTADLVQEVAAASREQSSGVAQINQALAQVDNVTQRNASSAEELSSTAEEMASQAEALEELMAFFKLSEAAEPQRPARRAPIPQSREQSAPMIFHAPLHSAAKTGNGRDTTVQEPALVDADYAHF